MDITGRVEAAVTTATLHPDAPEGQRVEFDRDALARVTEAYRRFPVETFAAVDHEIRSRLKSADPTTPAATNMPFIQARIALELQSRLEAIRDREYVETDTGLKQQSERLRITNPWDALP